MKGNHDRLDNIISYNQSVNFRLVTGDDDGYIVFWDMKKCLDPESGEDSLSYRSHNTYVEVSLWILHWRIKL